MYKKRGKENSKMIVDTAYMICCNDSIEYVVIGSKDYAERYMEFLKKGDYIMSHMDKASYDHVLYWHIREVSGAVPL